MKKETLICNLQRITDNIQNLDLPAQINAIYAFGSILREKENPHDIDLVVLYTQTPEQAARWERFEKFFSDSYGTEHSIRRIEKYLVPYQAKGIALCEAVKKKELSDILNEHGIEPVWAGCFSWTDILGYDPYGFHPEINKVLRRMVFGKHKGFQTKFSSGKSLPDGYIPMMVAKNHCLAWSKEKSNVSTNLLKRSVDEKTAFDQKELDHFTKDEIPRFRKEFLEEKDRVKERLGQANITVNWALIESKHMEIQRTGEETFEELAEKLEQARTEMKNYRNETDILIMISNIYGALEGYSAEENVAHFVIQNSKSRGVTEPKAREILRILGLPEDHIITIKKYGLGTNYELAKTSAEKSQLLNEAEKEKRHAKLLQPIIKEVHSIDPRAQIRLEFLENGKPLHLSIYVYVATDQLSNEEINKHEEELKKKGFKVEKNSWCLSCSKFNSLRGTETKEELLKIAKKMMSG